MLSARLGRIRADAMPVPTPFHARTAALCTSLSRRTGPATTRSAPTTPRHEREYFAFRDSPACSTSSPLYKYEVRGRDAGAFLARMMVRDVRKLKAGRVAYICWCDDDGKVIDDGTVTRLDEDHFRVTAGRSDAALAAAHGARLRRHDRGLERRASRRWRCRGRARATSCARSTGGDIDALKFFGCSAARDRRAATSGSRAPATPATSATRSGCESDEALAVWDALIDAGQPHGIEPAGLDALDVTRIEAGFILLGVDYFSARRCLLESRKSTPFELGFGWMVDLEREPFIGRDALAPRSSAARPRQLVGLEVDWEELEALYASFGLPPELPPAAGATRAGLRRGGRQVGQATSRTWSPLLKKYLALASVHAPTAPTPGTEAADRAHRRVRAAQGARDRRRHAVLRSGEEARSRSDRRTSATTRSSSAAATTAWSARPISPRPGARCWCSSAATWSAAPRSTEEIYPGFKFSVCSYVVSLLRPQIIRDLDLPSTATRSSRSSAPSRRSPTATRSRAGPTRSARGARSSRFSRATPRSTRVRQAMAELGRFVKPIIDDRRPTRPRSTRASSSQLAAPRQGTARLGHDLLDLHAQAHDDERGRLPRRVVRVASAHRADVGLRHHRHLPRRALARHRLRAAPPLHGRDRRLLPRLGLLQGRHRRLEPARSPTRRARHGAEIRTSAPVATSSSRASARRGVVLENGDEIGAKAVISGADPHRTFLTLVGEEHLDPEFATQIKRYKMRGTSGKVNLALDRLPEFACRPGDGVAPARRHHHRAVDRLPGARLRRRQVRRLLAAAVLNIVIPSLIDPTVAPPGKHVMSIFVQYAPYHLKEGAGRWPKQREAFGDAVIDTLAEYCPNLKDSILHRQVLTPWDLEQIFGLTEGNIFHGELSLEQLPSCGRAGLGALPDAGQEPLDVRLGHPSRRRHHGRAGRAVREDAARARGRCSMARLRRHRHRRRAQRPRRRRAARAGGPEGARPRAARRGRRHVRRGEEFHPGYRAPGSCTTRPGASRRWSSARARAARPRARAPRRRCCPSRRRGAGSAHRRRRRRIGEELARLATATRAAGALSRVHREARAASSSRSSTSPPDVARIGSAGSGSLPTLARAASPLRSSAARTSRSCCAWRRCASPTG